MLTASFSETHHDNTSVEKNLIRTLLKKYEKFGVVGRPVQDSNTLITVNYGLALIQILDLDENKQILRTNCWSRYVSHDHLIFDITLTSSTFYPFKN